MRREALREGGRENAGVRLDEPWQNASDLNSHCSIMENNSFSVTAYLCVCVEVILFRYFVYWPNFRDIRVTVYLSVTKFCPLIN